MLKGYLTKKKKMFYLLMEKVCKLTKIFLQKLFFYFLTFMLKFKFKKFIYFLFLKKLTFFVKNGA